MHLDDPAPRQVARRLDPQDVGADGRADGPRRRAWLLVVEARKGRMRAGITVPAESLRSRAQATGSSTTA